VSLFAGTGSLIRLALRRDRIRLPIWILLLAILPVITAASFAELYPEAAAREQIALTLGSSPAISVLLGPLYDSSIGGLTAWRLAVPASLLVALMSAFTVVRHTRGEEEAGRSDLLGANVVGRRAPLTAALIVASGAGVVAAALSVGGLVAADLPITGAIAFGLAMAAAGVVFAAVAAVASQLWQGSSAARGAAVGVLGVSFMLRAAGDTTSSVEWLSWISPLGWSQRIRAFADEQWWVAVIPLGVGLILAATAFVLSTRRDVGSGILATKPGPEVAAASLRSPLALAWRLHRGALIGWIIGFVGLGSVMGTAAETFADLFAESPELARLVEQLGGEEGLADAYISAMLGVFAIVASAYGIQAALRLRTEETLGRASPILSTAVPRWRWEGSHLVFALLGPALLLLVGGLAIGVAYGIAVDDIGGTITDTLAGALVQLPAVWVLSGLAAALFGVAPRFTLLAWGALVVVFLLGQLGPILQLDQWVLDISPFTHVPQVPGGELTAAPLLWLGAAAAGLTLVGFAGFARRDVG
jgi:ABC-2 type transport system permease protein